MSHTLFDFLLLDFVRFDILSAILILLWIVGIPLFSNYLCYWSIEALLIGYFSEIIFSWQYLLLFDIELDLG